MTNAGLYDVDAFSWVKEPQTVEIGTNVTSIGYAAFTYSRLMSVTIPDSVTSIGKQAFLSCNKLTSVTIPDSVTSIKIDAFAECSSLTSIIVKGKTTTEARNLLADAGLDDINIVQGEI